MRQCQECGVFVHANGMSRHYNSFHMERKFQCDECPSTFASVQRLKKHKKDVHMLSPCPDCGQMFSTEGMKRHRRNMHTPNDLKPYKCDVCPKGFIYARELKKHTYIHTGEKPYKCKLCSFATADFGNLAAHNRGVHQGIKRQKK